MEGDLRRKEERFKKFDTQCLEGVLLLWSAVICRAVDHSENMQHYSSSAPEPVAAFSYPIAPPIADV